MPNTNSLLEPYTTGTISIEADGHEFVGSGTLWATQAEAGDWVFCNGYIAVINEDIEDTKLHATLPWQGGEIVDQPYVLLKMSWLRYEPAILQAKVRNMIAMIEKGGTFLFVEGEEPDPSMGSEGQWALKTNEGSWKLWFKTGGQWELQGDPVGFGWARAWTSGNIYKVNDLVYRFGNTYISLQPDNIGHDPAAEEDPHEGVWWDIYVSASNRFEIWFGDSDQPVSGEELFKGYVSVPIQFPPNLAQSIAKADVAATAECVFSVRKNNVEFATITFGVGQSTGVFASSGASFVAGDKISLIAPNPRDVTLRGLAATLVAYRS